MNRSNSGSVNLRKRYLSTGTATAMRKPPTPAPVVLTRAPSRTLLRKFYAPKQMHLQRIADQALHRTQPASTHAPDKSTADGSSSLNNMLHSTHFTNLPLQNVRSKVPVVEDGQQLSNNISRLTDETDRLRDQIALVLCKLVTQSKRLEGSSNMDTDNRQLMGIQRRKEVEECNKTKLSILKAVRKQTMRQKELKVLINKEMASLVATIEERRNIKDPLKFARRLAESACYSKSSHGSTFVSA